MILWWSSWRRSRCATACCRPTSSSPACCQYISGRRSLSELATALVERGYRRVSMVETVGEFALRGGFSTCSPQDKRTRYVSNFLVRMSNLSGPLMCNHKRPLATLQTVVIAPVFPLGRQQGQRQDGVTRLRAHLATQRWSEASITRAFRPLAGAVAQCLALGPSDIFYDPLCSLACLSASDQSPLRCRR